MSISRRHFLSLAGAGATGSYVLAGLANLYGDRALARSTIKIEGYGALVRDPQGILDLPTGFRYAILSRSGQQMSDRSIAPSNYDGMAAFAGKNGTTILVRNHELSPNAKTRLVMPAAKMYDPNCAGGTTTLIIGRDRRLIKEYVSLGGTSRNCAGGTTPWGSWISSEETTTMPGAADPLGAVSKPHGYNFEVPIFASEPVNPIPLVAMGRFRHEGIAIDPRTGIVYQTEDDPASLFYRFIPKQPGKLAAGGILEALKIVGKPQIDTKQNFPLRQKFAVEWVRIEEPNPATNTVRREGFSKGAAQFMRGEGICYANGSFYFTCTQGGKILAEDLPAAAGQEPRGTGQVWKYTPGKTAKNGGTIELFLEPNDRAIVDMPDNITLAPNGDLITCEDGKGEQRLIGITPQGQAYTFARNARDKSEFAGACFSADGRTMFVNIYDPGITLAVWGNWARR